MNNGHSTMTKRNGVYTETHNSKGVKFEKSGVLHRDNNLPALIQYQPLLEEWRVEGTLHRTNGPARVTDLANEWWFDGKLHRFDGPAVEYTNGDIEWWLFDVKHPFRTWSQKTVLKQALLDKLILKYEIDYKVKFGL